MKRIFHVFMCILLCLVFSSCVINSENLSGVAETSNDSAVLLIEQEDVKISYSGICPDAGIGEGIYLLVENSRAESIIVNIAEVSLNGTMQPVIQPQMPLHLTSPDKQSKQPFIFTNSKNLSGKAQFKIKVLNENFEEIFVSDFVEVSF